MDKAYIAELEAEVERLLEAEEELGLQRVELEAELIDAQNRELFAKIEKRDETLRADRGE